MVSAMQTGFPYVVATCVGICFGALFGGAVLFATQTASSASAIEWVSTQPAPVRAAR
jgi:hypothetical protein